jgi:exosortase/archaeosortase family protein
MPENTSLEPSKTAFTFKQIKPFIIRGILLVVGWKLLYLFVLQPSGIPDNWLTKTTEDSTAWLLSLFYKNIYQFNHTIYIDKVETVIIAPQCNGLELFALYIGFILCIPTTVKRMLAFSIVGIAIIYILNVFRSMALAIMAYNNHYLIDFAHHYAFKLVIYAVVFIGWVLYTKKPVQHEA